MSAISTVGNWVRTNITGSGEAAAYTSKKSGVDDEYARIQDGLTRVGQDIDNVDQDIQLRKVSLRNFKDAELIVGGGAVGAVAGAGLGVANSTLTSLLAKPEVDVKAVDHQIMKPVFNGFTPHEERPGHSQPTFDPQTGQQIGSVVVHNKIVTSYEANISNKDVGSYTERTHTVNNQASGSPLADGLIGLGIGFGAGALIGTAVAVGRKALDQGYDGHDRAPVKNEGKKLLQTAMVGATIGGGVGLLNGLIEHGNAVDMSYKTESPVILHGEKIGEIPKTWERSLISVNPTHKHEMQPVTADVPKTNFLGHADVDSKKVDVHVDGRFGLAGGVVGGVVVGGLAGVAAGVAINVIRRAI